MSDRNGKKKKDRGQKTKNVFDIFGKEAAGAPPPDDVSDHELDDDPEKENTVQPDGADGETSASGNHDNNMNMNNDTQKFMATLIKENQKAMAAQQDAFLSKMQAMQACYPPPAKRQKTHQISDGSDDDEQEEDSKKQHEQDIDPFNDILSDDDAVGETSGNDDDDDEDILEFFTNKQQWGPPASDKIAAAVNAGFKTVVDGDKMKELLSTYKLPSNCQALMVPKVNTELWNKLRKVTRTRDIKLQSVQESIMNAAVPFIKIIETKTSNPEAKELKNHAVAGFKLLANAAANLTYKRRELIVGDLPPSLKDLGSSATPVTEWLFGEDLPKRIKEINDTHRLTASLSGNKKPRGGMAGGKRPGHKFPNKGRPNLYNKPPQYKKGKQGGPRESQGAPKQ